jgi:hypothetical protein
MRVQFKQLAYEVVRMLHFDVVGFEDRSRKITEVAGNDDVGTTDDCCGQDMPVIGIRQYDGANQPLIIGDDGILRVPIYRVSQILEPRHRYARIIAQHRMYLFLMHAGRPASLK